MKFGIQFPDLSGYKNPNAIKSDNWYLSAIETLKKFSKEDIEAVQTVLLALDSIGDKVESSELILSQIDKQGKHNKEEERKRKEKEGGKKD